VVRRRAINNTTTSIAHRQSINSMAFSFGEATHINPCTAANDPGAPAQPQAQAQPTTSLFGSSEL
jgi:hypothetical protein